MRNRKDRLHFPETKVSDRRTRTTLIKIQSIGPGEKPPIRWPKDPWGMKPMPKFELFDEYMRKPFWMKETTTSSSSKKQFQ